MAEIVYDEVYENGALVSRTPRTMSDLDVLKRDAPDKIRRQYAALRQWRIDADAVVTANTTPTKAQLLALYDRFGKLCDGLADILLTLSLDS